jgi:hypothetical protein
LVRRQDGTLGERSANAGFVVLPWIGADKNRNQLSASFFNVAKAQAAGSR